MGYEGVDCNNINFISFLMISRTLSVVTMVVYETLLNTEFVHVYEHEM